MYAAYVLQFVLGLRRGEVLGLAWDDVDLGRGQGPHRLAAAAAGLAGDVWHRSGLVFTSSLGTPVEPRNFHRLFKERSTAAGVPEIPVHSTRRTCASLLVELDVHPRVTMQILRHSQIAVTMDIYAQVAPASTRAALAKLGKAFMPSNGTQQHAPLLQNTAATTIRGPSPSWKWASELGWSQRDSNP